MFHYAFRGEPAVDRRRSGRNQGPRDDLDRIGCALPRFSPRQADRLMVIGTITHRQAPILREGLRPDGSTRAIEFLRLRRLHVFGGSLQRLRDRCGGELEHASYPVDMYIPGYPFVPRGRAGRPDGASCPDTGREGPRLRRLDTKTSPTCALPRFSRSPSPSSPIA